MYVVVDSAHILWVWSCTFVCICTCTYVDQTTNPPPHTHTKTIYTVATLHLVVLILFVTNSNHDNFEHVMVHAIHLVHQQWWNISTSVLTVHAGLLLGKLYCMYSESNVSYQCLYTIHVQTGVKFM